MKPVGEPVQHVTLLFPLPHDICCRAQGESVILVLARPLSRSSDADHKLDYLIILVAWHAYLGRITRGAQSISLLIGGANPILLDHVSQHGSGQAQNLPL